MITEAVHFVAPDGSELVVISKEMFEQLSSAALSAGPVELERFVLDVPAAVRHAISRGVSTLAAWRSHRGLSQTDLAKASGVHRITIVRMEAGPFGHGRLATRRRLSNALEAPLAAI